MNINKNVSIWRGSNTPPTQYHLWQKGDVLLHHDGLRWVENKVPVASADQDGLMSKEDKDKLDNLVYDNLDSDNENLALSAKQGKILLNKIAELNLSVYKPKGSVQMLEDLPVDNLRVGDVYNIINPFYIEDSRYPGGTNVVWTGSRWDPLGGTVDFSDYSTTEEIENMIEEQRALYSELNTTLTQYQQNTNQLIAEKEQTAATALAAEISRATAAEEALRNSKVDKEEGKSLVSDSEIEKLAGLPNSTELTNSIATAKTAGDNAQSDLNAHKQNKSNPHEVTKAQVGLGNVTNDAQVKRSEMGVANGVATLDADGKVPAAQLPSYVDDIIDVYATYSKSDTGVLSNVTLYLDAAHTQLVTGEAGKIYQNIANGESQYQFRWTGTIFSQTGASSLILGEVTGTAYDGAKGKANADNIAKIKGTSLSHIRDSAPITTATEKVYLNYECFEGNQYGAVGTPHTATIPAATTNEAGVMSAADKVKLDNTAISLANHKANNDKKHIPAGGHERQILAWKSDGTAKWEDLANMFTGLEELLAYGVEWNITVADPHITRIGNMSLHKTLPIQSQLKGCIAQGDKVIYWLNESDWRFRKEAITKSVELTVAGDVYTIVADVFNTVQYDKQWVKVDGVACQISSIDTGTNTATLLVNDQLKALSLESAIKSIELGAVLNGYDGTVRVYCPNFYIKSQIIGNTRRVWLSTVKIDNTWTYQHEILIDAYRSTVLNTVPENMGYLSTLPVNSAISVVNTATYCRGGDNRTTYDKYLTGANNTTKDIFRTDLGKPRTNHPRSSMRIEARKAGSEMLSYDQYKNIFYWLYVVEYANFNCQEAYNAELTNDGYHQGGLGNGVTNVSNWQAFNYQCPITPCGYGNDLGNGTGVKLITSPELTPANEVYMCRWRGFDNPFGDICTNLDGIIIDADANNHPNNMNYVYTCQDPEKYADHLNGKGYEKVGEEIHQSGYTKIFNLGDAAHIIPIVVGGNTTTYKCDHHWAGSKNTTLRTLLVNCQASNNADGGIGYFGSGADVSFSYYYIGFRSVSRFVSFSSQK